MSTRMDGIVQPSLFSGAIRVDVVVGPQDRYRVLAENLPWLKMGSVANKYRARRVDINNGRPLNLRMHLGALIGQSMNRWTDQETEDHVSIKIEETHCGLVRPLINKIALCPNNLFGNLEL